MSTLARLASRVHRRHHERFIDPIRARRRNHDLGERQACSGRLCLQNLTPYAVHRDTVEWLSDSGEKSYGFESVRRSNLMERPGTILAAAPTQENAFSHAWSSGRRAFSAVFNVPSSR